MKEDSRSFLTEDGGGEEAETEAMTGAVAAAEAMDEEGGDEVSGRAEGRTVDGSGSVSAAPVLRLTGERRLAIGSG